MSGEAVAEVRIPVEAGKSAEFARAVGLDPRTLGGVAPPTYYVVMNHHGPNFMTLMADVIESGGHVLHGEEEVEFPNGPVSVGEELVGEIRVVERTPKQGRSGPFELVELRLDLRRPDGETAVRVTRSLVARPGHQ